MNKREMKQTRAAVEHKAMIGKTAPALRKYFVQGWAADPDEYEKDVKTKKRIPMDKMTIQATSMEQARRVYASCHQMQKYLWDDGTNNPRIIIRVW